ncbi:hypothetical protein D3C78_1100330 [compost metagenome]
MLHALGFQAFLLLQSRKLAVQRDTFIVDLAPVVRNNRFRIFCIRLGQRIQQRRYGVYTFLKGGELVLLRLPVRRLLFALGEPERFIAFIGDLQRQRIQRVFQRQACCSNLLLELPLLVFLFIQLAL